MRPEMREEGQQVKLKRKAPRGQAMVEYSIVTHAILIGGSFGAWVFTTYLMNSISKFYESVYWVLTSSVP